MTSTPSWWSPTPRRVLIGIRYPITSRLQTLQAVSRLLTIPFHLSQCVLAMRGLHSLGFFLVTKRNLASRFHIGALRRIVLVPPQVGLSPIDRQSLDCVSGSHASVQRYRLGIRRGSPHAQGESQACMPQGLFFDQPLKREFVASPSFSLPPQTSHVQPLGRSPGSLPPSTSLSLSSFPSHSLDLFSLTLELPNVRKSDLLCAWPDLRASKP